MLTPRHDQRIASHWIGKVEAAPGTTMVLRCEPGRDVADWARATGDDAEVGAV